LNKLFPVFQYIFYLLRAKDEYSLHSPFVFDFYTNVVKKKTSNFLFNEIESLRKKLKKDTTKIQVTDFGAGSKTTASNHRTVSSIARAAEKKPSIGQLIHCIVHFAQPQTVIDLGTSLGITTAYESIACPSSKIVTFEGCPNIAQIARSNFEFLHLKNIEIIVGNIDATLPKTIDNIDTIDVAFFDANHRYEPTVRYFSQCLEKANDNSIFIFDDIYWSKEMKKAWEEIKHHPSVGISLDLYYIGILFFRKKQPVQHFTLK